MAIETVGRRAIFSCAVCTYVLVKRTSYLMHQFLRHDTYVCSNPLCSAAYTGHSELTAIASPSGIPDALGCDLPETERARRARDQAVEDARNQGAQMAMALPPAGSEPDDATL
ncbi:ogr/Delta-like zinc finger family protein [Pseudoxanthomonas sp. PXM02]|uniref:ogr/Delta-like zinc finger family protein n=1 Tax=Pseudoxanthomonas sp. PXM02 TaxID=2769294 RepID=UPI0017804D02|nr:ogr/Delta-like zinc finger family protein [Pseudoxanthomonas sp. PXM02]MBD9478535.1 hypothetical protein [Pseudoxanthomonas sp. PXM02]